MRFLNAVSLLTLSAGLSCASHTREQLPPAPSQPDVFAPGIISTGDVFSLALTPDARRAVFTRSSADRRQMALYYSDFDGESWSPAKLVPFSGRFRDLDPFITADGATLLFNSFRPVAGETERADTEIWSVTLDGDRWGEPVHLGAAVHSESADDFPSVTRDGVLYFGSTRPGGLGGVDVYRANRGPAGYGAPENVRELNSAAHDANPFVSPNGRLLIMASTRAGEQARTDLWVSLVREGRWTAPRRLGSHINTTDSEFCPVISPDGRLLYFSRIRWDGAVRLDEAIYRIPLADVLTAEELAAYSERGAE